MNRVIATVILDLLVAGPVFAGTGTATAVPEPTDALLVLLGVAGVVIGRRMHASRDRNKD